MVILLIFTLASCQEMKPVPVMDNSFSIYKTTHDYFNNVFVTIIDDKVYYIPDPIGLIVKDTTVVDTNRVRLANGYVLNFKSGLSEGVLNYTHKEYYYLRENYMPSQSELQEKLIDSDPFVEYYAYKNEHSEFSKKDTAIFNEIIRTNQIDKYFEKLK